MSVIDEDPTRLIFDYVDNWPVPNWQDKAATTTCKHCKEKMGSSNKHNCRLCGQVRHTNKSYRNKN